MNRLLRPAVKATRGSSARVFARRNHHDLGPEESLFKKPYLFSLGIGSAFIGLILYDRVYAEKSSDRSLIGSWLTASHPSPDEIRANATAQYEATIRQRDNYTILLSSKNLRSTHKENLSPMPVPDASHRGVAPGSVLDLSAIDERRPRSVLVAKKNTDEPSS